VSIVTVFCVAGAQNAAMSEVRKMLQCQRSKKDIIEKNPISQI
jgi:hypothetical protein